MARKFSLVQDSELGREQDEAVEPDPVISFLTLVECPSTPSLTVRVPVEPTEVEGSGPNSTRPRGGLRIATCGDYPSGELRTSLSANMHCCGNIEHGFWLFLVANLNTSAAETS